MQLALVLKATCMSVIQKYAEEAPRMDISRKKWQRPPDSSSRSHFQHACGRWLTIWSLLSVCLQSRERPTMHTTLQHTLLSPSTGFTSSHRHQLSSGHVCYNQGITQRCCISANICLFAFEVNPTPSPSSPKLSCSRRCRLKSTVT